MRQENSRPSVCLTDRVFASTPSKLVAPGVKGKPRGLAGLPKRQRSCTLCRVAPMGPGSSRSKVARCKLHRGPSRSKQLGDLSIGTGIGATTGRCVRKVGRGPPCRLFIVRRDPGNTGGRAPSIPNLVPKEGRIARSGPREATLEATDDRQVVDEQHDVDADLAGRSNSVPESRALSTSSRLVRPIQGRPTGERAID